MRPMRLTLLFALILTLAGCADATRQPSEAPSGGPSEVQSEGLDLTGTWWESTDVAGYELPDSTAVTLDFVDAGQLRPACTRAATSSAPRSRSLTGSSWRTASPPPRWAVPPRPTRPMSGLPSCWRPARRSAGTATR